MPALKSLRAEKENYFSIFSGRDAGFSGSPPIEMGTRKRMHYT
jgi:hypothetical protein